MTTPETPFRGAFAKQKRGGYAKRSQKQLRPIRAKARKFTGVLFAEKLEKSVNFAPILS